MAVRKNGVEAVVVAFVDMAGWDFGVFFDNMFAKFCMILIDNQCLYFYVSSRFQ